MADELERRIVEILQNTLRDNGLEPNVLIAGEDSMDTISGWDSLRFMSVFVAINEAFGLNPDFDDAIHYTSVKSLYAYLKERTA